MNDLFQQAIPILDKLEKAGFEAYFVGGSVRDHLLQREINDVDIATSATPEEVKNVFPKTVDVGIEHGTVLVLYKGAGYEVTTFRSESEYKDFRRPTSVTFIRSLTEDLQRRDFTMNAIAMDKTGRLIDPFHGQTAIMEQRIATVGQAEERFSEDALRMMRAVRFVSQLDFTIEDKTFQAIQKHAHLLEKIAVERKCAEFEKLLSGKFRRRAINLMIESQVYLYLPGLKGNQHALKQILTYECENLSVAEMWVLLAYCLDLHKEELSSFLRAWKLPNKQIKLVISMIKWLRVRIERDWSMEDLYRMKKPMFISVERVFETLFGNEKVKLDQWMSMYELLPMYDRSELQITGKDLLEWFDQPQGAWIKEMIETVEKAVINRKVKNCKVNIKEWLFRCNQK